MSLVHIPRKGSDKFTVAEQAVNEPPTNEPDFIIVHEVSSLPPPSPKMRVDPCLETTFKMVEAIEQKQNELLPILNKVPKELEKEADYSNKQLNHLAEVQKASKKYLLILSGAMGIMAALAGVKIFHMGVGFWKWLKKYTPTTDTSSTGKAIPTKRRPGESRVKIRRSHQREWKMMAEV